MAVVEARERLVEDPPLDGPPLRVHVGASAIVISMDWAALPAPKAGHIAAVRERPQLAAYGCPVDTARRGLNEPEPSSTPQRRLSAVELPVRSKRPAPVVDPRPSHELLSCHPETRRWCKGTLDLQGSPDDGPRRQFRVRVGARSGFDRDTDGRPIFPTNQK
jgi:hypothetical protein